MKHELISLKKQTDNSHINIYIAEFMVDGKIKNYQIASRRQEKDLAVLTHKEKVDAVRIMPYFIENGKIYVVFTKEYRYPIDDFIYGLPAGLVDDGEEPVESAIRELNEEIGAVAVTIYSTERPCYTSVGMGDEMVQDFEAKVIMGGEQKLDFSEDISIEIVDADTLLTFVDNNSMGLQTTLQAKNFYYRMKLGLIK